MTEIRISKVSLFSLECNVGKSRRSRLLNFRGGDAMKMPYKLAFEKYASRA